MSLRGSRRALMSSAAFVCDSPRDPHLCWVVEKEGRLGTPDGGIGLGRTGVDTGHEIKESTRI